MLFYTSLVFSQSLILDDFSSIDNWSVIKSDGVDISASNNKESDGYYIRIDYNFKKGSGYGGLSKELPLELKDNFQIKFLIKGNGPNNNLEVKLSDSTRENVWWKNNRNYQFPNDWKLIKIKKRDIEFAWGPALDKSLNKINFIEFIVSSSNGGKGNVEIKNLILEKLPDDDTSSFNINSISSSEKNESHSINNILDNNLETSWQSTPSDNQYIILNLNKKREFGGLVIDWDKNYATKYEILTSDDKKDWTKIYEVKKGGGGKRFLNLNGNEASFIKLAFKKSINGNGYGINEIELKNYKFSESQNSFMLNIAENYSRGYFPKYFNKEMSYWTVNGANSDTKEALINEEGMVEVDKGRFSIEPFLMIDKHFYTWNDFKVTQILENDYLPIPSVIWDKDIAKLTTTIFTDGVADSSFAILKYTIENKSNKSYSGKLFLTVRPYQVNPPSQNLNLTGGVSKIKNIEMNDYITKIDDKKIFSLSKPENFGCTAFDQGEIIDFISKDKIPNNIKIIDKNKLGSSVYSYNFSLTPNSDTTLYLGFPFHSYFPDFRNMEGDKKLSNRINEIYENVKSYWVNKLNNVEFHLPPSANKIINTLKSNLAYILINRDKNGIQPGSRSYERSWIRDGSMTSSALLKMGIKPEVKDYIDWYAEFQFENGKVPCVVDNRGPDPVPEYDSQGELIYAILQYFNFTKDTIFLKEKFPNVIKSVEYIDFLTSLRKTDKYKFGNDSLKAFYGLVPESISHEGYSAKPMHSYWDDFFIMKGLKDAVTISEILNENKYKKEFLKLRDEFKTNLYNSISRAINLHGIDFIPGCVELGDFDATSTTIALNPCNEFNNLPKKYLYNTFDKYFAFFKNRISYKNSWEAYTPYELRIVGTFNYLNEPGKSYELLKFFFDGQRPSQWNQWAEVVWNDSKASKFIGDMPHTWVGSDYINAVRSLFIYEDELNSSIILGRGLKKEWIDSDYGVSVKNLPTYYGDINFSVKNKNNIYFIHVDGNIKIPAGGIKIKNFSGPNTIELFVNNNKFSGFNSEEIIIQTLPANIELKYQ